MENITISEAVDSLRQQIEEAMADRPDSDLSLEIVEAELKIQGTLSRSAQTDGSGKVSFNVLGIGGEVGGGHAVSDGTSTTHSVTLKLELFDKKGPVRVNRQSKRSF